MLRGLGAITVQGTGIAAHVERMADHCEMRWFQPLEALLGRDSGHAGRHAAWIADRGALTQRKWGPVSAAALQVAREAVEDAGWTASDLADAALVVGTSRGNAAGWLGAWPGRRPFRAFSVSNSIHCEPCSAVSIELGIYGPNHVLASGCAAGLDALGVARMMLLAGQASRALVVAVDLPLVPMLLDGYAASGLLASGCVCDPFSEETGGMIPGEAAGAIALELGERAGAGISLVGHFTNSDGVHPFAVPPNGGRTPELMERVAGSLGLPTVLCPHATGTRAQAVAEVAMFRRMFSGNMPDVCLLKPWLGHTLGASGLVETAILAAFLRSGRLPPHPAGVTLPAGWHHRSHLRGDGELVCKLAHSIGGHNSMIYLQQTT